MLEFCERSTLKSLFVSVPLSVPKVVCVVIPKKKPQVAGKKKYDTPSWKRWRKRAEEEHLCVWCRRAKLPENWPYRYCDACLEKNRARCLKRYADLREKNPPAYSRDGRKSFSYRKVHLKNPRSIICVLDYDVLELFDACRRNWVTSPHYEPYQVAAFTRRILSLLQGKEIPIPYYGELRKADSSGLRLAFLCDEDNYQVLTKQQERTGCSLCAAVRDCLRYAIEEILLKMPDKKAQEFLWRVPASQTPATGTTRIAVGEEQIAVSCKSNTQG